jgi:transcriptional regulator with XRE-family HTH domain
MNPGTALSEARRRARLNQSELAARAGTSQATISAYESGAKEPSLSTLTRLLAATGHRLEVKPSRGAVREPSRVDLTRRGEHLAEVIGLAESLPARHRRSLAYPRLRQRRGGSRSRA